MSQRGALFPWRTIGGEETSAYYPAGTAQYHINADIVHALRVYMEPRSDTALLLEWRRGDAFRDGAAVGGPRRYTPRKGGAFCINEVTGPERVHRAGQQQPLHEHDGPGKPRTRRRLPPRCEAQAPRSMRRIARAIGLARRRNATSGAARPAACMSPYDTAPGIHAQDDSFLDRERWDFAAHARGKLPAAAPLPSAGHLSPPGPEAARRRARAGAPGHSFSPWRRKSGTSTTTTRSPRETPPSLPASRALRPRSSATRRWRTRYFSRTARMDLDDVNGNVGTGCTRRRWRARGSRSSTGLPACATDDGALSFDPRLPGQWKRLRFRLRFRGRLLEVEITHAAGHLPASRGRADRAFSTAGRHRDSSRDARSPSVSTPALECVIFDLDGVLTDTAELHYQAWKRLAEEAGPALRSEGERELKGVSRMESLEIILRHAGVSMTEAEKVALAEKKNAIYRELITTITPAHLLPGMADLLPRLEGRGSGRRSLRSATTPRRS